MITNSDRLKAVQKIINRGLRKFPAAEWAGLVFDGEFQTFTDGYILMKLSEKLNIETKQGDCESLRKFFRLYDYETKYPVQIPSIQELKQMLKEQKINQQKGQKVFLYCFESNGKKIYVTFEYLIDVMRIMQNDVQVFISNPVTPILFADSKGNKALLFPYRKD